MPAGEAFQPFTVEHAAEFRFLCLAREMVG
jgi:hypothetical protein